jgi:ribose 5-phosphate isomerase A
MLTKEETKQLAAIQALAYIKPGMTVGIGTGSTAYWFIQELGTMVKQGLICQCVPTSVATHLLAQDLGIPMTGLNEVAAIDVTVDGADEIDPRLNVIKGGGGALLQEKMVAAASAKLVIIADSSKYVQQLGAFSLPVEVIPYGWKQVQRHLLAGFGFASTLRMKNGQVFCTDHGHYILDLVSVQITDAAALARSLNAIPGVVENGLFIKMAAEAIIAFPDGQVKTVYPPQ